ncbi:hypothetical protein BH18ACT17_BH18ACT17_04840 [soil metagenome]
MLAESLTRKGSPPTDRSTPNEQEHELPDTSRILDLSDYWRMIRTRIWTVIAMATIVAAIAGAYVALRPPVYYSQAKVIVDPLVNAALAGTVGNPSAGAPDRTIEAEVGRSTTIATAVADSLGLDTTPQQLVRKLTVEPQSDSAVLLIGYSASTPETAAAVSQGFAEEYVAARKEKIATLVDDAIAPLQTFVDGLVDDAAKINQDILTTSSPGKLGELRASSDRIELEINSNLESIAEIRSKAGTSPGATIIQDAVVPTLPSGPSLVLASILGFIMGAILGAAFAIVLGLRANRVGGRDELAEYIGAPVMGVIPSVEGWSSRDKAELVARDHPGGPAAEAYRTLSTNIRFLRSQRSVVVIVVTSALPGEGKSATTANLAVVLAETGVRTLLVDADLRRPRAERFLGVPNGPGLREALEGSATLDDLVLQTDVSNLSIVRSGQMPYDPVALLAGPHAEAVFHDMRRLADVVICDAPPTLPVADASILAEAADAVLFVHDPAISSRTALEDAVRQLRTAGAEIAGGVYNNITSLQRNTLGYASFDRYYGPDERAKGPKRGAKSSSGTAAPTLPAGAAIDPPSGNGSSVLPPNPPAGVPSKRAER